MERVNALIALEDGRTFPCTSFTGTGETSGEVVFNTSMSGYQEILTDPSYRGQMVTMTYPLIGNYGVNPEDAESDRIQVSALLIKEYQEFPSNFRATESLADYLQKQGVLGIENFDTRALTRHIRKTGAMRAFISTTDLNPASLIEKARAIPSMTGQDLVKEVTTSRPYFWENGKPVWLGKGELESGSDIWKSKETKYSVVAFDFGIKYNILRSLEAEGCEVLVVPATFSLDKIRSYQPDGIFLSNGPGDPEPLTYAIESAKALIGQYPIFGICLGNQILGLALGGRTFKLKFGHRGGNQPVKNLITGKVEITAQNHGFAVDTDSMIGKNIELTHINLNDNTFEGFQHKEYPLFAVQYHPEAAPGPHDARYLFTNFIKMMEKWSSV
ncbi:MAG: carbamoyl-phosphate synthase small subunit [Deltaproteobacteria bacterium]|nr:MAG: carbamoyl-phosphate synthase small subunit [Deltaproteobacteria bacterium]